MAIADQGRSITFTAVNEGYPFGGFLKEIVSITFQGTGLTPDQRLQIRDNATPGSGSILVDYLVSGTSDNADLWNGRTPQTCGALSISNNTIAGTWVVTVGYRG